MKERIKIINILCHPPHKIINNTDQPQTIFNSKKVGDYTLINKKPFWVGFFNGDHHVVAAKELLKITSEFDIECWRPYGSSIKEVYSKEVDGIVHRVFPSFSINFPQIGQGHSSLTLLRFLKKYSAKNKIILNI